MKKSITVSRTIALEYGDRGDQVKAAQEMLAKTGSTIKVNGIFTIGMNSAVKAFQRKNGLAVTGIINYTTWTKLKAVAAKKKSTKRVKK